MNKSILERSFWVGVIGLAIYAAITGTNWFHNYHAALSRAESVSRLEVTIQSLQGTIAEKDAEIVRLKATPVR